MFEYHITAFCPVGWLQATPTLAIPVIHPQPTLFFSVIHPQPALVFQVTHPQPALVFQVIHPQPLIVIPELMRHLVALYPNCPPAHISHSGKPNGVRLIRNPSKQLKFLSAFAGG